MKEQNRFSNLLKHLMNVAKLKNYTLAKELQYDESYISKWVTGSLMPTEKTHEKVLQDISKCIVRALDEEGWQALMSEYQLADTTELEQAVFDNLDAEYRYVMDLKESTGSEVAPKTTYYPELTLAQFLSKMHHPVLRKVKEQQVISVMDILSLDRNYQLGLSMMNNPKNVYSRNYPGVSFSMMLNLDSSSTDVTYDVTFLLNLLGSLADINFNLYAGSQAVGKLMFAIRDAYSISGMIMDENHCISVTTSEDVKYSNSIYDRLNSLCSQENLIFRKTGMRQMLKDRSYIQTLLSRNQRWMLGFLTELLMPDDLFEELLVRYCEQEPGVSPESLRMTHLLSQSMITEMGPRILISEGALLDFSVVGELDFFNRKFILNPEQRMRYLTYACELLGKSKGVQVKILRNGSVSDMQHIPSPCAFLSDSMCHLRLKRMDTVNSIHIINKVQVCDLFRATFEDLWTNEKYAPITDPESIGDFLRYVMQMIRVQMLK